MKYVALLRGINVGGKNKLKMAELKSHLEVLGFKDVESYIQSGNIIFESDKPANQSAKLIEDSLPKKFKLDSQLIRVLVLPKNKLKAVVDSAPADFGREPDKYHYDFIFLKDLVAQDALDAVQVNPKVDNVWIGPEVLYFRRLSAKRTSSHLSRVIGKPIYQNMTIRNWNTVNKLNSML